LSYMGEIGGILEGFKPSADALPVHGHCRSASSARWRCTGVEPVSESPEFRRLPTGSWQFRTPDPMTECVACTACHRGV